MQKSWRQIVISLCSNALKPLIWTQSSFNKINGSSSVWPSVKCSLEHQRVVKLLIPRLWCPISRLKMFSKHWNPHVFLGLSIYPIFSQTYFNRLKQFSCPNLWNLTNILGLKIQKGPSRRDWFRFKPNRIKISQGEKPCSER